MTPFCLSLGRSLPVELQRTISPADSSDSQNQAKMGFQASSSVIQAELHRRPLKVRRSTIRKGWQAGFNGRFDLNCQFGKLGEDYRCITLLLVVVQFSQYFMVNPLIFRGTRDYAQRLYQVACTILEWLHRNLDNLEIMKFRYCTVGYVVQVSQSASGPLLHNASRPLPIPFFFSLHPIKHNEGMLTRRVMHCTSCLPMYYYYGS